MGMPRFAEFTSEALSADMIRSEADLPFSSGTVTARYSAAAVNADSVATHSWGPSTAPTSARESVTNSSAGLPMKNAARESTVRPCSPSTPVRPTRTPTRMITHTTAKPESTWVTDGPPQVGVGRSAAGSGAWRDPTSRASASLDHDGGAHRRARHAARSRAAGPCSPARRGADPRAHPHATDVVPDPRRGMAGSAPARMHHDPSVRPQDPDPRPHGRHR